jgi:hypothetical protein
LTTHNYFGTRQLHPNRSIVVLFSMLLVCLVTGCAGGQLQTPGKASTRVLSQKQQRHVLALARRYSRCMQVHGDPTFPNPTIGARGVSIRLGSGGLGPGTPQYDRAEPACQSLHDQLP